MKLIHFFFKNKKNKSEKDNLVSQSSNISKNNNSTNSTTTGSSANICNNMNNNKLNKAPIGSVNNNDNTLLATNNSLTQKHAKLINKKADESLDSLSYFDETHIQKIKNELNSNIKQTQLIVSTGINNNNNNLNTKTSIANNDNNNYFNLNNNNEENITSSAFMNSNNGCNVINSNNYDTSNNNATTTTTTGGSGGTTITNNSNQINSGGNSSGSAGGGGGGGNRNRINNENTALCQSTRTNLRDSSSISNRKEKKTSVGYRLGKRKLLFEKRRQISDYALIFAMTGVFLMIVETEFSMSLLYSKVIFCLAGIINETN